MNASRWSQTVLLSLLALALVAPGPSARASSIEIKMATIAPENAPYVKFIRDMGDAWKKVTEGRVSLVVYAGGQAGDEQDIIRKMRINQYHSAALTVSGLYDIDEYFNLFQIPFFLDSYGEMVHVLKEVSPLLTQRLEKKGFVHLAWGYLGWIHIFTKHPVTTVEDLKRQKIFAWAGNDDMVRWYRRNGFQPVALSFPDIVSGLQTGLIEAVPLPPLAAMQLGSFRQASHMLDLGFAPMVGGMVISQGVWNKIDEKDQVRMLEASQALEDRFLAQIPKLDETAIKMMGTQGLTLSGVKNNGSPEWTRAAETFAADMGGGLVPGEIFDLALKARSAFRSRQRQAPETP